MALARSSLLAALGLGVHASPWPADDEIGAANYLSEVSLSRLAPYLTSASKAYKLGLDVRHIDPAFGDRQCSMFISYHVLNEVTYFDDYFLPCANGVNSQLDGLGHLGLGGVYYNGWTQEQLDFSGTHANLKYGTPWNSEYYYDLPEMLNYNYLTHLGVDQVPPLVTRGIVLDMVALFAERQPDALGGGGTYLKGGTAINETHVVDALARQNLEVQKADVVLFYTGWVTRFRVDPTDWISSWPGITMSAARYLTGQQVLAVGADTAGVETIPNDEDVGLTFPVHVHLLKETGTYILENIDTSALIADDVHEFLFALSYGRYRGAVQAVISPIAIGGTGRTVSACQTPPCGDDEIGAANYLSAVDQSTLARFLAAGSQTYPLGLDVRHTDPAFGDRQCNMFMTHTVLNEITYFDDYFLPCANGVNSQIDGLGHLGLNGVFYNGWTWEQLLFNGTHPNLKYGTSWNSEHYYDLPEFLNYNYLTHLGVDQVPAMVTRGIVLDMVALFAQMEPDSLGGGGTYLKGGTAITVAHVLAALARQQLAVQKADVVLFYTGWVEHFRVNPSDWIGSWPGISMSAAEYLTAQQVLAVGADTAGLETIPNGEDVGLTFPVHVHLLKDTGTYILENIDTSALIADDVQEFLFMLSYGEYRGAVQAVINPIAIGSPRVVGSAASRPIAYAAAAVAMLLVAVAQA